MLTNVIKPFIISTIKFKNVTNNDCEGKKKIRTLDLQRVGTYCEPMIQSLNDNWFQSRPGDM